VLDDTRLAFRELGRLSNPGSSGTSRNVKERYFYLQLLQPLCNRRPKFYGCPIRNINKEREELMPS
jgi:hypothetical protein